MQKSEIIKKYKEKNIKFDYKVEERTEKVKQEYLFVNFTKITYWRANNFV